MPRCRCLVVAPAVKQKSVSAPRKTRYKPYSIRLSLPNTGYVYISSTIVTSIASRCKSNLNSARSRNRSYVCGFNFKIEIISCCPYLGCYFIKANCMGRKIINIVLRETTTLLQPACYRRPVGICLRSLVHAPQPGHASILPC